MPVQHQEITVTRLGFESKKTPQKNHPPGWTPSFLLFKNRSIPLGYLVNQQRRHSPQTHFKKSVITNQKCLDYQGT